MQVQYPQTKVLSSLYIQLATPLPQPILFISLRQDVLLDAEFRSH
jgi:hypothetical protein